MLRTKLKFIKDVFYKLKRSYGLPVQYYTISSSSVNPSTGVKSVAYSKIDITRAIVLRAREFRSFVYDLAFISANKDFTTGGYFDPEDRQVIIAATDVPVDFNPLVDDYVVFQNDKYTVTEIYSFEDNYAWGLTVRKLRGADVLRTETIVSVMGFAQVATTTKVDMLTRTAESVLAFTDVLHEVP